MQSLVLFKDLAEQGIMCFYKSWFWLAVVSNVRWLQQKTVISWQMQKFTFVWHSAVTDFQTTAALFANIPLPELSQRPREKHGHSWLLKVRLNWTCFFFISVFHTWKKMRFVVTCDLKNFMRCNLFPLRCVPSGARRSWLSTTSEIWAMFVPHTSALIHCFFRPSRL